MKFLMCVGAEKAGTTWLHHYLSSHPEYTDIGKELNLIQRDDFVPDIEKKEDFRSDIFQFFDYISKLNAVTGDFTHYEGSTANIFRLFKQELGKKDIEIVPVYIMRDPLERAWSAWNMHGYQKGYPNKRSIPRPLIKLAENHFSCKYEETVKVLDEVFPAPLYFFYEEFFTQQNMDSICDALEISRHSADLNKKVNVGSWPKPPEKWFAEKFSKTEKNISAVKYISERFENVPWKLENYS